MLTHNRMDDYTHQSVMNPSFILLVLFSIMLLFYYIGVVVSRHRGNPWPLHRTLIWFIGILSAMFSVSGPLAAAAHKDFGMHMMTHLLLGMLAPLCMVMGAPITLLLRTLSVPSARKVSIFLRFGIFRFWREPVVTTLLNIGGLWILYTTNLYTMMHQSMLLYLFVHFHVFLAGYLFTAAFIYVDPVPHRSSFVYRSIIIVTAFAGHGILSKYIYTHPPSGVPAVQAETGSMMMYYGGDAIDLLFLILFCLQWYQHNRNREINDHHKKTNISQ